MFIDGLLMFESPVQIMVVLIIALVVFGPKRLPEIGKQLGSALRELKKAGNDVVSSFSAESYTEPARYDYSYPGYSSESHGEPSYTEPRALAQPTDLTDYTIVGVTAAEPPAPAPSAPSYDDYAIAGVTGEPHAAPGDPPPAGPGGDAAAGGPDGRHEGVQHA